MNTHQINIKPVNIITHNVELEGLLRLPDQPLGMVLFSHGSGSSRLSKRNNFVAELLYKANIGSLLFDLLTEKEDQIYTNRFNIEILTQRLLEITKWLMEQKTMNDLPMGYFGASTGAASALKAAARLSSIKAVVSRGGRPDLAQDELAKVQASTLLIVGEKDPAVLVLNQSAYKKLKCIKQLEVIPGATHLFEEPGTLEQAAQLATEWFIQYL